jgi:hypothetical protein
VGLGEGEGEDAGGSQEERPEGDHFRGVCVGFVGRCKPRRGGVPPL